MSSDQVPIFHRTAKNPRRLAIEAVILGALYVIYSYARNANEASSTEAFQNAKHIIRVEEFLSIYIEQPVHEFFLTLDWVVIGANYFYGSLHFIVTIFALIYVFIKDPSRYARVRTTIVTATLIALAGFLTFPLMPPRLLPASYRYIDTLAKYPTFWSFNEEKFATISNQFAAMPSVHITWATWCVFALLPYISKRWLKMVLIAYPFTTFFVIVITSNHYLLDAVGGLAVFYAGYWIARLITRK